MISQGCACWLDNEIKKPVGVLVTGTIVMVSFRWVNERQFIFRYYDDFGRLCKISS